MQVYDIGIDVDVEGCIRVYPEGTYNNEFTNATVAIIKDNIGNVWYVRNHKGVYMISFHTNDKNVALSDYILTEIDNSVGRTTTTVPITNNKSYYDTLSAFAKAKQIEQSLTYVIKEMISSIFESFDNEGFSHFIQMCSEITRLKEQIIVMNHYLTLNDNMSKQAFVSQYPQLNLLNIYSIEDKINESKTIIDLIVKNSGVPESVFYVMTTNHMRQVSPVFKNTKGEMFVSLSAFTPLFKQTKDDIIKILNEIIKSNI